VLATINTASEYSFLFLQKINDFVMNHLFALDVYGTSVFNIKMLNAEQSHRIISDTTTPQVLFVFQFTSSQGKLVKL
jgi:hypothetical protein